MRMIISIQLENPALPKEYRPLVPRFFQAGFEMLNQREKAASLFDGGQPYSFSVYLPKAKFGKNIQMENNLIKIIFSTSKRELLEDFQRAAEAVKGPLAIEDNHWTPVNIRFISEKAAPAGRMRIRMLSPLLVSEPHERGIRLLGFKDEAFVERLRDAARRMLNDFGENPELADTLEAAPCGQDERPKEVHVLHGGRFYRGTVGELILSGGPELMALAYDCGIGIMREQGFGLFEWVKHA